MQPLWKGRLNFGLVSIPVSVYPGAKREDPGFTLLDRRDMAPIGTRRFNKRTGQEVPKEDVVKGYEYASGEYVVVEEAEIRRLRPEKAQDMDIVAFVNVSEIEPSMFVTPYNLEPGRAGSKGYALLRSALLKTRTAGIAGAAFHGRNHLCAVLARGPGLALETLRYEDELRDPSELKLPQGDPGKLGLSDEELELAQRLISDMQTPWKPELFNDPYREELRAALRRKAASGEVRLAPPPPPRKRRRGPPADIRELLKESVAQAETARGGPPSRYMH